MKTAIVLIGILIFTIMHEFGHMKAAQKCGIKVNEFAVGFGKEIIQKEKNGVKYSLRLFPLGGFCAFDDKSYDDTSSIKQIITLLAGPFMNILSGYLMLAVVSFKPLECLIVVKECFIGVWGSVIDLLFSSNVGLSDISGMGGVAVTIGGFMTSFRYGIALMALLSLILGIGNLIPIPGLDGGKIVGSLYELITRRKISKRVHVIVNIFAIVFIAFIALAGLISDIRFFMG